MRLPTGVAVTGTAVVAGALGAGALDAGSEGMEAGAPEGLTDGAAGTWAHIIAPRMEINAFMKVTPDLGPLLHGLIDKQAQR